MEAGLNNNDSATTQIINTNIQPVTPILAHTVAPQDDVTAYGVGSVAVHGNQLFVGRSPGGEVEVFDATTFSLQRKLQITDHGTAVLGLATCDVNNCLYVSDYSNQSIRKVDLSKYNIVLKWSVGSGPRGLSVNASRNLLVACWASKIVEYTTDGSLVREVCFNDNSKPFHAIQLPNEQFVVSHIYRLHRVSVVGLDGQVIRSYGDKPGSEHGQLCNPHGLALFSKQGGVLVADYSNNRIIALDSSLREARQLPLPIDDIMQQPVALCLDESRGRLFVGENHGHKRVLVFDNVINFDAMFKQ